MTMTPPRVTRTPELDSLDDLGGLPLLSGLGADDVERLRTLLRPCEFGQGDLITRQGGRGARVLAFFIIVRGRASIAVDGRPVRRLGPGDHFGEIGLLEETARTATVTADTDLRCLALSGSDFRSFAASAPTFAANLRAALTAAERD
jgi:CRP/FNR family transcriptional regulator, cyclic AMP receptor protein